MRSLISLSIALLVMAFASVMPAHAQATRTWVSGVGNDANPCSRTAPCKTFAGAISKTAAGGEINIMDPGAYGTVTITKSIAIIAEGPTAGVLSAGTNGIIINALATDSVTLRGLDLNGLGTSLNGVRILSAAKVHISNCIIRRFNEVNNGNGILVAPTSADVNVVIKNCYISDNRHGVGVDPVAPGKAHVTIDDSVIAGNSNQGVRSKGPNASVHLSKSVITGNNSGLTITNSTITSSGNNVIANNNTNGAPVSSTIPLQ